MLLGQVVAISVATNLFFYALATSAPPKPPTPGATSMVSPALWLSVGLSLATIASSPYTTETTFLPNLLVMHVLLVVPLVLSPHPPGRWNMRLTTLYRTVAYFALALHLKATAMAFAALPPDSQTPSGVLRAITSTLNYHPAQSSIGWDVVWTSISFIVWTIYTSGFSAVSPLNHPADSFTKYEPLRGSNVVEKIVKAVIAMTVGSVGFAAPWQWSSDRSGKS